MLLSCIQIPFAKKKAITEFSTICSPEVAGRGSCFSPKRRDAKGATATTLAEEPALLRVIPFAGPCSRAPRAAKSQFRAVRAIKRFQGPTPAGDAEPISLGVAYEVVPSIACPSPILLKVRLGATSWIPTLPMLSPATRRTQELQSTARRLALK